MMGDGNEKCGFIWFSEGKDHSCNISPPKAIWQHVCRCSCGQVHRRNEGPRTAANPRGKTPKVPPFILSKWKRGKKLPTPSSQHSDLATSGGK